MSERDAKLAARRAADARKASAALDRLLGAVETHIRDWGNCGRLLYAYEEFKAHHNDHYGVPPEAWGHCVQETGEACPAREATSSEHPITAPERVPTELLGPARRCDHAWVDGVGNETDVCQRCGAAE